MRQVDIAIERVCGAADAEGAGAALEALGHMALTDERARRLIVAQSGAARVPRALARSLPIRMP